METNDAILDTDYPPNVLAERVRQSVLDTYMDITKSLVDTLINIANVISPEMEFHKVRWENRGKLDLKLLKKRMKRDGWTYVGPTVEHGQYEPEGGYVYQVWQRIKPMAYTKERVHVNNRQDVCSNCGKSIGNLSRACVFKDRPVCQMCHDVLEDEEIKYQKAHMPVRASGWAKAFLFFGFLGELSSLGTIGYAYWYDKAELGGYGIFGAGVSLFVFAVGVLSWIWTRKPREQ